MTVILDLQPCPFCGDRMPQIREAEPNIFQKPQFETHCTFCTAVGPAAMSKVNAAQLWNRRTLPERVVRAT